MLGITLLILIGLLALAIPVAAGLGILGLSLSAIYSKLPLSLAMGEIAWGTSNNFLLVAIPFFVLLGEILLRSGMAERMYNALVLWVPWLPGGLMHSNIAACAMFAATSGSSVATAATIGTVALGEVEKRGYSERLFLGTIAAGGTLFSLTVLIICLVNPALGGKPTATSWKQRIAALPDLIPPLVIFLAVIGSIYAGWATATESAALGVIAAIGIAAANRRLTVRTLLAAFEGTMRTTAMIMAILLAAYFLNFVITSIGLTGQVNSFITSLGLSKVELLVAVVIFYFILGMFMETLSMMVATVPIIAPIMIKAGYDPIWFGIVIIILMELAMITPPVGINLYVVQGLRKKGKIDDVIVGTSPFIITMLLMLVILSIWPIIALWLPQMAAT